MYKCERCNRISNPREKANKIVVEKRQKKYEFKNNLGEIIKTTFGWEIVKEITVCNNCIN